MEALLLCSVLVGALLPLAIASQPNAESVLARELLETYDRHARPVKNVSSAVQLEVSYALMNIESMDENNAIATVRSWIKMVWTDEYLQWEPEGHSGIQALRLPADQLWQPDLQLFNSLEAREDNVLAVVMANGLVLKITPSTHRVQCAAELTNNQFTYHCPFKFGSWTYSSDQINQSSLGFFNPNEVDVSYFVESPVWGIVGTSSEVVSKTYEQGGPEVYQSLDVELEITRKYP